MIRIAVVEDEKRYQEQIKEYLEKYEKEYQENFHITYYRDGDDISVDYKAQYDIILMDIQMSFVDGMTAAREIRQKDSQVIIIFLTNMSQYAVKGYEVDALDYILKPIDYFTFSKRLQRAVQRCNRAREERYLAIPFKGGIAKLSAADIYYIESHSHNLHFMGNFEPVIAYGTIKEMEEKLREMHFSRANSGCIVNLRYVSRVEDGYVCLKNIQIPLSRTRKNAFLEALTNYVSEAAR